MDYLEAYQLDYQVSLSVPRRAVQCVCQSPNQTISVIDIWIAVRAFVCVRVLDFFLLQSF